MSKPSNFSATNPYHTTLTHLPQWDDAVSYSSDLHIGETSLSELVERVNNIEEAISKRDSVQQLAESAGLNIQDPSPKVQQLLNRLKKELNSHD